MDAAFLDPTDVVAPVSPNIPAGIAISVALVAFLVLMLMWQLRVFARLSDVICDGEPRSGGLFSLWDNVNAIRRDFRGVVSMILLIRPARVAILYLRKRLEHSTLSGRWFSEQLIDPHFRMSRAEKEWRRKYFVQNFAIPVVVFLIPAIGFAVYSGHSSLVDGWLAAAWTAALVLVLGFAAKWVHKWGTPLILFIQGCNVLYVYGHGTLPADLRVPIHRYLDTVWPGWEGSCAMMPAGHAAAYNCALMTEIYAFALVAGFYLLNLVILLVVYLWLAFFAGDGIAG